MIFAVVCNISYRFIFNYFFFREFVWKINADLQDTWQSNGWDNYKKACLRKLAYIIGENTS